MCTINKWNFRVMNNTEKDVLHSVSNAEASNKTQKTGLISQKQIFKRNLIEPILIILVFVTLPIIFLIILGFDFDFLFYIILVSSLIIIAYFSLLLFSPLVSISDDRIKVMQMKRGYRTTSIEIKEILLHDVYDVDINRKDIKLLDKDDNDIITIKLSQMRRSYIEDFKNTLNQIVEKNKLLN